MAGGEKFEELEGAVLALSPSDHKTLQSTFELLRESYRAKTPGYAAGGIFQNRLESIEAFLHMTE